MSNSIILITTHSDGFLQGAGEYRKELAEYFQNNYHIDSSSLSTDQRQEESLLNLSARCIFDLADVDFTDEEWETNETRIGNGDEITVINSIEAKCKAIIEEDVESIRNSVKEKVERYANDKDVLFNVSELMVAISDWKERLKLMRESDSHFSESDAKKVLIDNMSLYERACLFTIDDSEDVKALAVRQLPEPSEKKDEVWPWVETLKSLFASYDHLILLLHDRDLSEFVKQPFRCVYYKKEKVSLAVFQHSNPEFRQIKGTAKDIFCLVDNKLSALDAMRRCDESNSVAQGYYDLLTV